MAPVIPALAGGWATVHLYVHKTGKCGAQREVLASYYSTGARTANGERFNPDGLTAASHDYALNTVIEVTNPNNGRRCTVRVNDRGPYGIALHMGARIDFARGAARCLGMTASTYVCAPEPQLLAARDLEQAAVRSLKRVAHRVQMAAHHLKQLTAHQIKRLTTHSPDKRLAHRIGERHRYVHQQPAIRTKTAHAKSCSSSHGSTRHCERDAMADQRATEHPAAGASVPAQTR